MDNFPHRVKNILLVPVTRYPTYIEKLSYLNNDPFLHGGLITFHFMIPVSVMNVLK